MPKSQRIRARFTPVDLAEHFKNMGKYQRDMPPISEQAHTKLHRDKRLIYTSKATLDTNAGTPIYPPFSGRLVWVQLNVTGAPTTSDLTCDILLNGTVAVSPTIPENQNWGYRIAVDEIAHFSADNLDYLQVQITDYKDATGPLLCHFGFREYSGGMI